MTDPFDDKQAETALFAFLEGDVADTPQIELVDASLIERQLATIQSQLSERIAALSLISDADELTAAIGAINTEADAMWPWLKKNVRITGKSAVVRSQLDKTLSHMLESDLSLPRDDEDLDILYLRDQEGMSDGFSVRAGNEGDGFRLYHLLLPPLEATEYEAYRKVTYRAQWYWTPVDEMSIEADDDDGPPDMALLEKHYPQLTDDVTATASEVRLEDRLRLLSLADVDCLEDMPEPHRREVVRLLGHVAALNTELPYRLDDVHVLHEDDGTTEKDDAALIDAASTRRTAFAQRLVEVRPYDVRGEELPPEARKFILALKILEIDAEGVVTPASVPLTSMMRIRPLTELA